eukprot:c7007_g1_i1 orf=167-463(+)
MHLQVGEISEALLVVGLFGLVWIINSRSQFWNGPACCSVQNDGFVFSGRFKLILAATFEGSLEADLVNIKNSDPVCMFATSPSVANDGLMDSQDDDVM